MIMTTNNKKTFLGMRKNTILYIVLCFTLYKLFDIGNKKDICELIKECVNQHIDKSNETAR